MGNINLYVDEETERLLKNDLGITPSELFREALKKYIWQMENAKKALKKLPSSEEIGEKFKFLPTAADIKSLSQALDELGDEDYYKGLFSHIPSVQEIKELSKSLDELGGEDYFKEVFDPIPSVEEIRTLNEELDKTIEKLETIKELKD